MIWINCNFFFFFQRFNPTSMEKKNGVRKNKIFAHPKKEKNQKFQTDGNGYMENNWKRKEKKQRCNHLICLKLKNKRKKHVFRSKKKKCALHKITHINNTFSRDSSGNVRVNFDNWNLLKSNASCTVILLFPFVWFSSHSISNCVETVFGMSGSPSLKPELFAVALFESFDSICFFKFLFQSSIERKMCDGLRRCFEKEKKRKGGTKDWEKERKKGSFWDFDWVQIDFLCIFEKQKNPNCLPNEFELWNLISILLGAMKNWRDIWIWIALNNWIDWN